MNMYPGDPLEAKLETALEIVGNQRNAFGLRGIILSKGKEDELKISLQKEADPVLLAGPTVTISAMVEQLHDLVSRRILELHQFDHPNKKGMSALDDEFIDAAIAKMGNERYEDGDPRHQQRYHDIRDLRLIQSVRQIAEKDL
jgi:hypothetical protein